MKTPVRKTVKKKEAKKIESPAPSMGDIRKYMKEKVTTTDSEGVKTATNNTNNSLMNVPNQIETLLHKEDEVRKISSTEDTPNIRTKLTFKSTLHPQNSVKDRIQKYQENNDNLRGSCVKSSGRCSTHKCVLLREIVCKKMSTMEKTGKIVWTMGEVTVLRCPAAEPTPVSTDGQTSAIKPGLDDTANKRRRTDFDILEDESDTQTQRDGCNTE